VLPPGLHIFRASTVGATEAAIPLEALLLDP